MFKSNRLKIVFVLAIVVTATHACGGKPEKRKKGGRPPTVVETAPAILKKLSGELELVGAVRAAKQSLISAEVDGRVTAFDKSEGDRLSEGETVIILDDTEYRLKLMEADGRLKKAEAEAERAHLAYERVSGLFSKGVVPQEDKQNSALALKAARAEKALREAEFSRAQRYLDLCKVKTPFPGYLASKMVDIGEWVDSGDTLFEAVDIDHVDVVVEAPDKSVGMIRIGAEAQVTLDGYPGKDFSGKVSAVSPKADIKTRSFTVKISVDNPGALIKAGMVARAKLSLENGEKSVLMIPHDAVVWRGQRAEVFTVNSKDEVFAVPVTLGRQDGEFVEACCDLSVGQAVIVTGNEILKDGMTVIVIP